VWIYELVDSPKGGHSQGVFFGMEMA